MTLISGDQSPFWDAPLKLRVLADMGERVVHDVHTADLFSRPPVGSSGITVTREAYQPDENVTRWTASVEAVPFLGRMHVLPSQLTSRGVILARVAGHMGKSLEQTTAELTVGDWLGLAMTPADVVAHGVDIAPLTKCFTGKLRRPLLRDLRQVCEDSDTQAFDALFGINANSEGAWPDVATGLLRQYLDLHGVNGEVTLTTSVDKFADGSLSLQLFVDQYDLVRVAYNEAMYPAEGEVETEFVQTLEQGELPHYAIVRHGQVLRRVNLSYKSGDTVDSVLARVDGEVVAVLAKAVPLTIDFRSMGTIVMAMKGSAYWPKAVRFMKLLEERLSKPPKLHGVSRLHFHALDALEDVDAQLRLPPYLAKAFGTAQITGVEFASRWRTVVEHAMVEANRLAGDDLMLVANVLREQDVLGQSTFELLRQLERILADYRESSQDIFAALKGKMMSKGERAAASAKANEAKAVLDRSVNPGLVKAAKAGILAGVDTMRARLIVEHVAVASSLQYWDVRPFTHWVEAVPGWYEGIRARAELIEDPLL